MAKINSTWGNTVPWCLVTYHGGRWNDVLVPEMTIDQEEKDWRLPPKVSYQDDKSLLQERSVIIFFVSQKVYHIWYSLTSWITGAFEHMCPLCRENSAWYSIPCVFVELPAIPFARDFIALGSRCLRNCNLSLGQFSKPRGWKCKDGSQQNDGIKERTDSKWSAKIRINKNQRHSTTLSSRLINKHFAKKGIGIRHFKFNTCDLTPLG